MDTTQKALLSATLYALNPDGTQGSPADPQPPLAWRSDDPTIASIVGNAADGFYANGIGVGTTNVSASTVGPDGNMYRSYPIPVTVTAVVTPSGGFKLVATIGDPVAQ